LAAFFAAGSPVVDVCSPISLIFAADSVMVGTARMRIVLYNIAPYTIMKRHPWHTLSARKPN
jgi:hypothetical protein